MYVLIYDQIGNPLNYRDGMAMTWQNGRQLATLQKGTDAVSYTYDADGLRTSKTVNGQTTQYFWDDRGVMYKQANTGGNFLWFYADPDGTIGSINYNDARYALLKNAQGDVIGLADSSGSIVALYSYDSWGNIISITDGSGNDVSNNPTHIANINPIRYRGYYYDAETGFYYLRSRYYDPEMCRFINADGVMGANGGMTAYNLFAYCGNNPVSRVDPNGNAWIYKGVEYKYDGTWSDFRRAEQGLPPTAYEEAISKNKYLPSGGTMNGGWITGPIWGTGVRTDTITFIAPQDVKDLYVRKGSYVEIGLSGAYGLYDALKGNTKGSIAALFITSVLALRDETEYRRLCDAIDLAFQNGNGLVIMQPYCNDPRSWAGAVFTSYQYVEWDNEFGKYPFAHNPY